MHESCAWTSRSVACTVYTFAAVMAAGSVITWTGKGFESDAADSRGHAPKNWAIG